MHSSPFFLGGVSGWGITKGRVARGLRRLGFDKGLVGFAIEGEGLTKSAQQNIRGKTITNQQQADRYDYRTTG